MKKEEYMALMEAHWEKMESLSKIKTFYELENAADKVFTELNRTLLEGLTAGEGKDRRLKKSRNTMGKSKRE